MITHFYIKETPLDAVVVLDVNFNRDNACGLPPRNTMRHPIPVDFGNYGHRLTTAAFLLLSEALF